jgi:geranylgeranyl diphosphate synthase type II
MAPVSPPDQEFEQSFHEYILGRLSGNTTLFEAMRYSLLNGGKRIRPSLVLEAAKMVKLPRSIALTCAYALEIVHCFSLVHDDLPSMDNDDFRRGKPTTHRQFGEAQALLAGDALLNFAYETFHSCALQVDQDSFRSAFQLFTQAIQGMIWGQSDELILNQNSLEELLHIQQLKTGKLFEASILCPLLLAGIKKDAPLFLECQIFAKDFGLAFQIADDIEDQDQDRIQGEKNILSHLGKTGAIKLAKEKMLQNTVSSQFSATQILLSKLK